MQSRKAKAKLGRSVIPNRFLRAHLARIEEAAGRLQRAAAGMALMADSPALREAALAGDAERIAAGLEALAVAAFQVCEGARTMALGAVLLDHEARRCWAPSPGSAGRREASLRNPG